MLNRDQRSALRSRLSATIAGIVLGDLAGYAQTAALTLSREVGAVGTEPEPEAAAARLERIASLSIALATIADAADQRELADRLAAAAAIADDTARTIHPDNELQATGPANREEQA